MRRDIRRINRCGAVRGVRAGTKPGQTDAFIADMVDFFGKTLAP